MFGGLDETFAGVVTALVTVVGIVVVVRPVCLMRSVRLGCDSMRSRCLRTAVGFANSGGTLLVMLAGVTWIVPAPLFVVDVVVSCAFVCVCNCG